MEETGKGKRPPSRIPAASPQAQCSEAPSFEAGTISSTSVTSDDISEDEQMEKFYALLANIKAMRDMFKSASCGDSSNIDGGAKKRPRTAGPLWRPAFQPDDFKDVPIGDVSKKERRSSVRPEDGEEGEVVEEKQALTSHLLPNKN